MIDAGRAAAVASACGLAAAVSWATVALLARFSAALPKALPSERSLHTGPIPRVGGLAVWAGLAAALALPDSTPPSAVWIAAWFAVTAVSLADDHRGVAAIVRIAVQSVAATGCAYVALRSGPGAADAGVLGNGLAIALAALAIVWAANLFNFMDGSDGLAGAMAMTGYGAYAIAASGVNETGPLCLMLVAATVPFLIANLPVARIFMGDVGSVPLGFFAAVIGLAQWRAAIWPLWFPLLVFLPFIVDASVTLARRLLRGERVWEAHRMHYYQRLNLMGAGHDGTLAVYGAAMLGTSISALLALRFAPALGWPLLGAWAIAFGFAFERIDRRWRAYRRSLHAAAGVARTGA